MKAKPITVILFVGDRQVQTLSPSEREAIARRLSQNMSTYYTAHSEQYERLQRGNRK
jgi:hypothetical protein